MRYALMLLLIGAAGVFVPQQSVMAAEASSTDKPEIANSQDPPPPTKHVVLAGESLSSIATDKQLDSWVPLWNVNTQLTNPDQIDVGQELVIPTGPTTERPLPVAAVQPAQRAYVPASSRSYSQTVPKPANYAAGSGDVFARIRAKESGGNYATNTGNGYYGAYQFDVGTWNGYGGYARADLAPPAVQDAKAADTYARRGCSPWPNTCR